MNKHQIENTQNPVRILVFSASLSKDSLNTKLAKIATAVINKNGGIVDFASMSEFDCPSFNQDLEATGRFPPGAEELRKRLLENDAFIIASPDYNGSISGVLKNTIDWVSRFRPQPFNGRQAMLLSASPSVAGGNPGLWALRMPLEKLGSHVFPAMFSLANAHNAFSPEGDILEETLSSRLKDNLLAFKETVEASKNYPLMKENWKLFFE